MRVMAGHELFVGGIWCTERGVYKTRLTSPPSTKRRSVKIQILHLVLRLSSPGLIVQSYSPSLPLQCLRDVLTLQTGLHEWLDGRSRFCTLT